MSAPRLLRSDRLVPWAVAGCLAAAVPGVRAQTPGAGAGGEVLVERTVAIVGGAVVTQSDVELAVTLGLVEPGPGDPAAATEAMIDRWLMLHEVARFSPAEPDPALVDARLSAVRARAGGDERLAELLARDGFTTARLAGWLRDDLRITAYLDQRFASAGVPADAEVTAYAETHRAEFERDGVAAAEIARTARARLLAERRRDLIADWLADLRRRTDVVEFRRGPG